MKTDNEDRFNHIYSACQSNTVCKANSMQNVSNIFVCYVLIDFTAITTESNTKHHAIVTDNFPLQTTEGNTGSFPQGTQQGI